MDDDPILAEIVRREASDRIQRILSAVSAKRDEAHAREAYRHAHTLAGLSDDRIVVDAARRLTQLYADARGRVRIPDARESQEAVRLARDLAARFQRNER